MPESWEFRIDFLLNYLKQKPVELSTHLISGKIYQFLKIQSKWSLEENLKED